MDKIQKIQQDMKSALKKGDAASVSVLRLLQSEIKNKTIEKRKTLTETEIDAVVRCEIKKRQDAINLYKQANRHDLVEKENLEIAILKQYVPPQLSLSDLKKRITEIFAEGGEPKNFGEAMKRVMGKLHGQADGQSIKQMVEEIIMKK